MPTKEQLAQWEKLVWKKCPECEGSGKIEIPAIKGFAKVFLSDCALCQGTGLRYPMLSEACPCIAQTGERKGYAYSMCVYCGDHGVHVARCARCRKGRVAKPLTLELILATIRNSGLDFMVTKHLGWAVYPEGHLGADQYPCFQVDETRNDAEAALSALLKAEEEQNDHAR